MSNLMATVMKTVERNLYEDISAISVRSDVRAGSPLPLGTQEMGGGVNVPILSRYASRVRLDSFDRDEDAVPSRTIDLNSADNHTGDVWHGVSSRSSAVLIARQAEIK